MGHYLLLVTTHPVGTTSKEVRDHVANELGQDPSFAGGQPDNCRFYISSPVADYFVIGGAFSGLLIGEELVNNGLDDGRDCDAMLITEELYETHLKQFEGQQAFDNDFVDLEGETVSPQFIGRKWLVVVDYHQ
jgi:hypothetical protein